MNKEELILKLNATNKAERLSALKSLFEGNLLSDIKKSGFVNNHIHTTYSFSPYSPTAALFYAYNAGLETAGIMDHDSVGGCEEFIEAGKIANMAITCGFECRVKMDFEPYNSLRINNPDQIGVAYVAIHGIPHQNIKKCEEFLAPFREKRNIRNRKMTEKINMLLKDYDITLDFDKDVVPLSQSKDNGSITERHISYALAKKLCEIFGKGEKLVNFLTETMNINIPAKILAMLGDSENKFYEYDLLGLIKSELISAFYIDANDECPDVKEFIALANEVGGISAYAYLGDVGDSVTGDKKTQKFEDDFLDELFETLKNLGFNAITYMPSRNTLVQLSRVISLCDKHSFFEISGEDINSPRQSFICEALAKEEFKHLSTSTYALIGHEIAATKNIEDAFVSKKTIEKYPNLKERITHYYAIGK